MPRKRKRPRRNESGTTESYSPECVEQFYRTVFFEALDLLVNGIKDRFNQLGYKVYSSLEALLVKSSNGKKCDEELQFVKDFYKDDFNTEQLSMQLQFMSCNLPQLLQEDAFHDFSSMIGFLREFSGSQRSLIPEVCRFTSLILVMQATNTVSERSFSSLRRVKSYLRATMSQTRLNSLMVLHVHKTLTDSLSLIDIGNDFVKDSNHIFEKFSLNDN